MTVTQTQGEKKEDEESGHKTTRQSVVQPEPELISGRYSGKFVLLIGFTVFWGKGVVLFVSFNWSVWGTEFECGETKMIERRQNQTPQGLKLTN